MRLFSLQEREIIKNSIIVGLKKVDGIISIILVGSGAVGFNDNLSDLDFSIIIDSGYEKGSVMAQVKEFIDRKWKLLHVLEIENRGLQVYILDNFLEIDVGYETFENTSAVRKNWLVMYDKTGKIEGVMKQTWENNKSNHGKTEMVDVDRVYASANRNIWHFLMHSIVAIKRGKYWRAIGEMDIARNTWIELLGLKYSLETKRYRNVDMFPDEIKIILQKTIPKEFSLTAFRSSIDTLIDAIYDKLELFYGNGNEIIIKRKDIKQYGKEILE